MSNSVKTPLKTSTHATVRSSGAQRSSDKMASSDDGHLWFNRTATGQCKPNDTNVLFFALLVAQVKLQRRFGRHWQERDSDSCAPTVLCGSASFEDPGSCWTGLDAARVVGMKLRRKARAGSGEAGSSTHPQACLATRSPESLE